MLPRALAILALCMTVGGFLPVSTSNVALADGFIYIPNAHVDIHIHPPRPHPPRPHPPRPHPPRPRPPIVRPIPRPRPRPNFPMQVTRHRVDIEIDDTVVKTKVEETFYNPNPRQLEGQYMFPLPPGASISGFKMKIGGQEVSGEVLEKDKARGIYESIVRQVKDPGLLEYVDRGLFRARVFPIPPRGGVDVTIQYTETVQRENGVAEYRYPLDTGKYASGPYQNVVLDLKLRSTQPLRSIQSPSHKVDVSRKGEKEARVSFEAKSLAADKDFKLVWNVGEDALAPVLLVHRNHEKQGFYYLAISPRPEKPKKAPAKDVVFVIDTSGSMLGRKIDQVKKALRYCVDGLNDGDRFNIVDFSTEARRFRDSLETVTKETREQARTYIDQLVTRGGTNLEEGLRYGLQNLGEGDRLQMAVLLTDGEPTIGIVRPEDLLKSVRTNNKARRRVFAFAVGEDLNAKLLDQLVKAEQGASQYIRDQEDIELRLSSFYDKIDSPVLTDIRVEFPSGGFTDVYPKPFPDLFKGEQLAILGRFEGSGHKSIVVRGKFLGEERVFEYSLDFGDGKPNGKNDHVARLWAARKVGYLIEQMRLTGETSEVKGEVIRLAKLYGIITPYTSYLIVEEDNAVAFRRNQNGRPHRLGGARARPGVAGQQQGQGNSALDPSAGADGDVLERRYAARDALLRKPASKAPPSEAAGGVQRAGESKGGRTTADRKSDYADRAKNIASAGKAFEKARGKQAIEFSRRIEKLKKSESEDEADDYLREQVNRGGVSVKKLAGRTFYLQGSRWIDAALTAAKLEDEKKVDRIKYLSDAYFALLKTHKGIGKILSVGSSITFVWNHRVISIDG